MITYRKATIKDIDVLTKTRIIVLRAANKLSDEVDMSEVEKESYEYYCKAIEEIKFGIYACSPEDSSFKAVFTEMDITECKWLAHDGQQPDE